MVRKIVTATASAALCLSSVSPALAQNNYAFSGFEAPRGATATVNLRVPLDRAKAEAKPTYGLTFGYGQTVGSPTLDGRSTTRELRLADLRFSGGEVAKAQVMSFDLANLDEDQRLNMFNRPNTGLIIVGIVALGVAACLIAECFEDDDDDDDIN